MTRLPSTFAPLAEMAERAAIEHSAAFAAACAHGGAADWGAIDEHSRRVRTRAFAALLSDLTRPESQALWLRWLAERLGVPVPVVVGPTWARILPVVFVLGNGTVFLVFGVLDRLDACMVQGMRDGGGTIIRCHALDNPDSADAPIRALVLAVLTVGGAA